MADFVKLNGYNVKDKKARNDIENIINNLNYFDNFNLNMVMTKYNYLSSYFKTLTGIDENVMVQGVTLNDLENRYIVAFVNEDGYSDSTLIEFNKQNNSFYRFKRFTSEYLGHANDIAFNPNTNKYYITTGSQSSLYPNKIAVVNASTLEFESHITLPPLSPSTWHDYVWNIAYNNDNDKFICSSQRKIYIFDSSFNLEKEMDFNPNKISMPNTVDTLTVGAFIRDNTYNMFIGNHGYDEVYTWNLASFNIDDGALLYSKQLKTYWGGDEFEGAFYENDEITIIGGQEYFTIRKLIKSNTMISSNPLNYYLSGLYIAPNTDLNDLLINGKYYSPRYTHSETLLNLPTMTYYSAFTLDVVNLGYDSKIQTITFNKQVNNNLIKFERKFDVVSGTWTPWVNISNSYVKGFIETLIYNTYMAPAIITAGGNNMIFSIPLPKLMDSDISINDIVISGNITARYLGEYIVDGVSSGNPIQLSNNVVNVIKEKNNLTFVVIKQNGTQWKNNVNNISFVVECNINIEIK